MNKQAVETTGGSAPSMSLNAAFRRFKPAVTILAAVLTISAAGTLSAQSSQSVPKPAVNQTPAGGNSMNVNVVNTPTVNVGSLPSVTISGTPTVAVGSLPPLTLSGTPTVNANVTFPASQAVTVSAPGPLTNVGRFPGQQVMLIATGPGECPSTQFLMAPDGSVSCFDISNYPGQILVITDVFWSALGTPNNTCIFGLGLVGRPGFGPVFESTAVAGADGIASKTEHLTTGVKLTSNPQTMTLAPAFGSACKFGVFFGGDSFMQGYLLPNQ